MTDTLGAVIQPRRVVSEADAARIRAAMAAHADAYRELREAVRVSSGSVRELAALTGMSTKTIQRWREDRDASD